jgi:hypothetical protein
LAATGVGVFLAGVAAGGFFAFAALFCAVAMLMLLGLNE